MSRKPSLFNEALAGFFRSTAAVATRRAEHDSSAGIRDDDPSTVANPLAEAPAADSGTDRDWLTKPGA